MKLKLAFACGLVVASIAFERLESSIAVIGVGDGSTSTTAAIGGGCGDGVGSGCGGSNSSNSTQGVVGFPKPNSAIDYTMDVSLPFQGGNLCQNFVEHFPDASVVSVDLSGAGGGTAGDQLLSFLDQGGNLSQNFVEPCHWLDGASVEGKKSSCSIKMCPQAVPRHSLQLTKNCILHHSSHHFSTKGATFASVQFSGSVESMSSTCLKR